MAFIYDLVLVLLCVGALPAVSSKVLRNSEQCFKYTENKFVRLNYFGLHRGVDKGKCKELCRSTDGCSDASLIDERKYCVLYTKPLISITIEKDFQACEDVCIQNTECKSLTFYENECYLFNKKSTDLPQGFYILDHEGDKIADRNC